MISNRIASLSNEQKPPEKLLPWLTYVHFLTDKLKSATGDARLEVLRQEWVKRNWWDKHTLGIQDELVLHREILMWSQANLCWYARTIIPESTYKTNTDLFDRLRKESLGHLIFQGSVIHRQQMYYYSITQDRIEYHWLNDVMHQHTKELWVRLSEFSVQEKGSFFLTEILLPGLEDALSCSLK